MPHGSPPGLNEGQRSSISVCLGRCSDLLIHPVDDVSFVPDDRTRTQLDLLGEGPIVHAGIDKGLANASHLNNLEQGDEVWRSM